MCNLPHSPIQSSKMVTTCIFIHRMCNFPCSFTFQMQLHVRHFNDQLLQMAYWEEYAVTDHNCVDSLDTWLSHNQLVPRAASEQAEQQRTRLQTILLNKSFRKSSGYLCSIGRTAKSGAGGPSYPFKCTHSKGDDFVTIRMRTFPLH